MESYRINAAGKRLGRIASEAANALQGKHTVEVRRDRLLPIILHIEHASDMLIDSRKLRGKSYERYSGYPGGLTFETLEKILARKGPEEVLRLAIYGMLPDNRLRRQRLKQVVITK